MTRVFTNYNNAIFAADGVAIATDLFYRGADFHNKNAQTSSKINFDDADCLGLEAVDHSAFGEIV